MVALFEEVAVVLGRRAQVIAAIVGSLLCVYAIWRWSSAERASLPPAAEAPAPRPAHDPGAPVTPPPAAPELPEAPAAPAAPEAPAALAEAVGAPLTAAPGLDPDDDGMLAILSETSTMLVLELDGRGARLVEAVDKPLPYRQNNARVRSPYILMIQDAAGDTLFHAPFEVDPMCILEGEAHQDEHVLGHQVIGHEAVMLTRIPVLEGARSLRITRQLEGHDAEPVELARLELPR